MPFAFTGLANLTESTRSCRRLLHCAWRGTVVVYLLSRSSFVPGHWCNQWAQRTAQIETQGDPP